MHNKNDCLTLSLNILLRIEIVIILWTLFYTKQNTFDYLITNNDHAFLISLFFKPVFITLQSNIKLTLPSVIDNYSLK